MVVSEPFAGGETASDGQRAECSYFEIRVVDAETGSGLPLVEFGLTDSSEVAGQMAEEEPPYLPDGTDDVAYAVTDSAGRVALDASELALTDPGLESNPVHYHASSHGYVSRSGTLMVQSGERTRIELTPRNVAERRYRVTGQGIYRDSVLLGYEPPIEEPLLNSQVTGLDTVYSTVYDDRIYWFYGDTAKLSHPLGNFQTTGATSELPANGGLHPAEGIDLEYFTGEEDGFVKPMVPLEDLTAGSGNLVWIGRLMTVHDDAGEERLVAGYSRLAELGETTARGLLVFDDAANQFDVLEDGWSLTYPVGGQGTSYDDPESGEAYWFFGTPWPRLRVPADFAAVRDPASYEYFTPLEPGTEVGEDVQTTSIEFDGSGGAVWGWKRETEPITQTQETELIEAGVLDPDDAHWQLTDVDSGNDVAMSSGCVKWNDYREKWILIGHELFGENSVLGEVWYAEADAPTGPWQNATKILTHDSYSFYNGKQHAFFEPEGGRYVYFEGTYTKGFSNTDEPTPLYDYNQVMYRLDLEDPRLGLPLEAT